MKWLAIWIPAMKSSLHLMDKIVMWPCASYVPKKKGTSTGYYFNSTYSSIQLATHSPCPLNDMNRSSSTVPGICHVRCFSVFVLSAYTFVLIPKSSLMNWLVALACIWSSARDHNINFPALALFCHQYHNLTINVPMCLCTNLSAMNPLKLTYCISCSAMTPLSPCHK